MNIIKCNIVTFTRAKNPTYYQYVLNGQSMNRENADKDLGVIADDKLNFKDHLDKICTKTMRTLGLIKKIT